MIIKKIQENIASFNEKSALVYNDNVLTYKQLALEIEQRVLQFGSCETAFYLDNDCQLENLLNLLAIMAIEKSAVVFPKELNEREKHIIIDNYKLLPIDNQAKSIVNNKSPFFLGVLTSGTTSIPKLIWKDNDCWEAAFNYQSNIFQVNSEDKVLVLDALAYSANLNAVLHALWIGATVHLVKLKNAKKWGQYIDEQGITSIFLVPSHLNFLVNQKIQTKLKSIVTAGEKLTVSIANAILNKFEEVLLTEYYGTSELGHITFHQNQEIVENPITVGKQFPEVKIKITDNQLFIKSPYVSPEFKNVCTVGDLGNWVDGRLCLLGRAGRMYNRRGVNVFAQEIEAKAMEFPSVNNAILIGIKNQKGASHKLVLFYEAVFKKNKDENTSKLLNEYLIAVLPATKRPQKVIELESIPKNLNGKINVKLLEKYIENSTQEKVEVAKIY